MAKSCATCAFVTSQKDPQIVGKNNLFCQRGPPTPLAIPVPNGVQIIATFPVVVAEMHCGEYALVGHEGDKTFSLFG